MSVNLNTITFTHDENERIEDEYERYWDEAERWADF